MSISIWFLSNISSEMYGDSTRPYFLGKYLSENFTVNQYCNISKSEKVVYYNFFENTFFSKPRSILKAKKKIVEEINKKGCPKIIYAHQLLYGLIGVFLKRKFPEIILISDLHTSSFFELKEERKTGLKQRVKLFLIPFLENLVVKNSDQIVTVSKETEEILTQDYPLSKGKIHIIKNATDTNIVYKKDFIKINQTKKNENVLVVFPNPRGEFLSNDLEFLFEIADKIQETKNRIQFVVLGGGEVPETVPDNVLFTGYVENYNEWLNKAAICIATYPSNAVCGGVRNKICDYLAVGKPIIATKESMRGFDDLVNGINYYECNTVDSFIEKLNFLAEESSEAINLMKEENLKKSLEYSWENRASELSELLKNITNA
ncbi:MAG: glycosyltransferase [Polaribacter sp.]|nr:glycosyltransferase [Polaribacter sp.]MDG1994690.1 glycosyltransferase [Polaribacter sp.]